MSVQMADERALTELVHRHRELYAGAEIDTRLERIIRDGAMSKLSDWDALRILRMSLSVYFDTHVETVSGHHTATYLRFESIARFPQLIRLLARDMADWIRGTFEKQPITGIVTTSSSAGLLAEEIAGLLHDKMRLRVSLTAYDGETGKIGTQIKSGAVRTGERFVALNDVTTRGNCVNKLGQVIIDHGGVVAGMMVFARRDSGQFPLVKELIATHPFYFTTDLDMPQWEPSQCPLCRAQAPLLSWKDLPELSEQ
jgi:orotate phosphoribosyltransferase